MKIINRKTVPGYLPVILFLLLLSGKTVLSQEKSLKASAPSVVKTGVAFNYVVTGEVQGDLTFNPPEGIRLYGAPSSMVSYRSSNINGRLQNVTQISYTYVLIPEKTGDFVLPPARIKQGRKEYISNEVRIKVVEEKASDSSSEPPGVIIQLIPSRMSIYEGEQIIMETKVMVRERMQITAFPPRSYEGFWVDELQADDFARNEVYEGYQYRTQVLARDLLTAQRKGDILIGPYNMDVNIQKVVKSKRRSVFDDPFFDSPFQTYENTPAVIKSNTVSIKVKPLPAGAPAGFNGAVGSFRVKAGISRDSIEVNESLSLKLTITGKGNLGLISAPEIDFPRDIDLIEPKKTSSLKNDEKGSSGSVSFEYAIIPRHGGHYRIAPVEFSFFNPSTGRYDRYISEEFNFFVAGDTETGELNAAPVQQGLFRDDVRDLDNDILFIKLSSPVFFEKGRFIARQTWYYLVFVGGLSIVLGLFLFWRRKTTKESDIFYVRNKKAWKLAGKRLRRAKAFLDQDHDSTYEEILKAVYGYLSDRLSMNTADISRESLDGALRLKNIPDSLKDMLWSVIDDCEMARYSPESGSNKLELYNRAVQCLGQLEEFI